VFAFFKFTHVNILHCARENNFQLFINKQMYPYFHGVHFPEYFLYYRIIKSSVVKYVDYMILRTGHVSVINYHLQDEYHTKGNFKSEP
jgi:hypothetical protein